MKITELHIQNIKRLKAFAVGLDGEPLLLTGDNGAGKSSVLDALFLALTGKGLEDPVRRGSTKASIKLVINGEEGEYTIEKRITTKSRTLTVTCKDGAAVPSPQAFLDGLVGSLAFDPLEFVRMKPRAQAVAIRELSGLDVSKLEAEYKAVFAERTAVNRTVGELSAQLKDMPNPTVDNSPLESDVSAAALITKRDEMSASAAACKEAFRRSDEAGRQVRVAADRVQRIEEQLAEAKSALHSAEQRDEQLAASLEEANKSAPTQEAMAAITQQIRDVDTTNAGIHQRNEVRANSNRAAAAWKAKQLETERACERADQLTTKLDAINEAKADITSKVKMPVEGMTFDDDGVMVEGCRFDQLSTAEQIRTSAMVAMASNPKLKIILIREGALVNAANMKVIYGCAAARDYQLLIEKFQPEAGAEGLHIEDGAITHIDGVQVAFKETTEE
jgi:DNA repair ATPase RecN